MKLNNAIRDRWARSGAQELNRKNLETLETKVTEFGRKFLDLIITDRRDALERVPDFLHEKRDSFSIWYSETRDHIEFLLNDKEFSPHRYGRLEINDGHPHLGEFSMLVEIGMAIEKQTESDRLALRSVLYGCSTAKKARELLPELAEIIPEMKTENQGSAGALVVVPIELRERLGRVGQ